jgi:hypothetical protein
VKAACGQQGLVAIPVGADVVRVVNARFLVRGFASGDLVQVRLGEDGQLWAGERLRWSGHCAIRVIPFEDGPLGGSLHWVLEA